MSEREDGREDVEFGYTEWRCTNCGNGAPKRNPPCDRCGGLEFERVEVRESDFDAEIRGPSTVELLRENALTVGAGIVILLVGTVAISASAGLFVVADPFGFGYRFGAVEAVTPNDDGTLTAAELHGQVAAAYDDTSMRWYGRGLELAYESSADSNAALATELTEIGTWYATYVGDGGEARSLQITATVRGGGRARVTIARADAAAFAAGDISESEYRSRIFASA